MSQGSIIKTPPAGITRKNHSMLVENDQVLAVHPNGLLTYSDHI